MRSSPFGCGSAALGISLVLVGCSRRYPAQAGLAWLCLVTIDLTLANAGLVITIPQTDFEQMPEVVQAIRAAERANPSPGSFRIHRLASWVPVGWSEAGSTQRLRDLVDWEIDTLQRERSISFGSRGDPCCSRKCLPLKMIPASRLVVRT